MTDKLKWWARREEWGRQEGSGEAQLTAVKIFDQHQRETERFNSGNKVKVEAQFVVHEEVAEPHFGVAIFREDGVYCYGPNTLLDGYKIERLKRGEGKFSIEFESLTLAPATYRLSVAIWDKREVLAYSYHPGFYQIHIVGENDTGELFYLSHWWDSPTKSPPIKLRGFSLASLDDKWKKRISSEHIRVSSLEILDMKEKLKNAFQTNQGIKIRVRFKKKGDWRRHYLWIGIYRRDGIYCHGSWRKLKGNEREGCLVYPALPLLQGKYLCSTGIWESSQQYPLACHHGLYPFEITSSKPYHGTIQFKHRWSLELPQ
jgi:hypothetical protein